MKILAFTDLHGDTASLKELFQKASKEDILAFVCAGDITFFGAELQSIVKRFKDMKIPLVLIPGNHETSLDIENISKRFDFIKSIHGKGVILDSSLFFGCGGSKLTPFSTPFELDEKEFEAKLKKFKNEKSNKFILVVHEPPYNTKLDLLDTHLGSKTIRRFIEKYQPDYCICGHYHENNGKEDKIGKTIVINPGPSGEIIDI